MRFEVEIPDDVIREAIMKAICEIAVEQYQNKRDHHSRREYDAQVKAATKAIVDENEDLLIEKAVEYAGNKLVRDYGKKLKGGISE